MVLLGGPEVGPLAVVEHLVRVMAGWPGRSATVADLLLIAALALVVAEADHLRRNRDSVWIFYGVLVAVPAGLLVFDPPTYLFPRYFLVLVPFVYQLGAMLAVRGFQMPRLRLITAALLAAFGLGQALLLARFLQVGRGDPAAGVAFLAAHTPTPEIPVASSRPLRLKIELGYYDRFLPPGRSFVVPQDASHGIPPWLLVEDRPVADAPEMVKAEGVPWRKVAAWDSSDLSGQTWILYERVPSPASTAASRGAE
jgi:hypothetical protein